MTRSSKISWKALRVSVVKENLRAKGWSGKSHRRTEHLSPCMTHKPASVKQKARDTGRAIRVRQTKDEVALG